MIDTLTRRRLMYKMDFVLSERRLPDGAAPWEDFYKDPAANLFRAHGVTETGKYIGLVYSPDDGAIKWFGD